MSWKSGYTAVEDGLKGAWAHLVTLALTLRRVLPGLFRRSNTLGGALKRGGQEHSQSTRARPRSERIDLPTSSTAGEDIYYAIGDIHGRADLIRSLVEKIEEDCADAEGRARLIFLGDYFDRGLESKQVVDFLLDETVQKFDPIFIKGNHEEALLSFLEDPKQGPVWARFGGRETLVSYGVRPPRSLSFNEDWKRAHQEFRNAFPDTHYQFMQDLKASARIGKFGFVHAGVRPGVPFEEQTEKDLLWIRDEFLKSKAELDVYLIHGHTPVDQATNDNNRINVDTGAYYSGRLTAVRLIGDEISFISTRP